MQTPKMAKAMLKCIETLRGKQDHARQVHETEAVKAAKLSMPTQMTPAASAAASAPTTVTPKPGRVLAATDCPQTTESLRGFQLKLTDALLVVSSIDATLRGDALTNV